MPRHRVFGTPRAAPQRVSARRSTLNGVGRLTGLPVARGAARGSPCPRDIVDAPRSARLPARDRKRRSRGHLNVADVIAAEATRRRGSGSAVSTRCGPVRVDRASRRLAGPATRARATAGRAVGSLAGAGHLRARRVASRACRWRMLLCENGGTLLWGDAASVILDTVIRNARRVLSLDGPSDRWSAREHGPGRALAAPRALSTKTTLPVTTPLAAGPRSRPRRKDRSTSRQASIIVRA